MKKFINRIDTLLDESLAGFAKAHADIVQLTRSRILSAAKNPPSRERWR